MIRYDQASGTLASTAFSKIAAHYYISHESMQVFSAELKPHMGLIDLLRLFAMSREFKYIPIRESERIELQRFIDKVPIPVKGTLEEPSTKINILLQAYISKYKLEGFDICSDMVYVSQSAARITRALFEIALRRGWAALAETLLALCKAIEHRMWLSATPLRQFISEMPQASEICRKIERKAQFQWDHFYDMTPEQIEEVLGMPRTGHLVKQFVRKLPKLELEAYVQPLTRSVVRVELELKVSRDAFEWDTHFHGKAEPFWVLVYDCDQEQILHYEQFILR